MVGRKLHDYLTMILEYLFNGVIKVDMWYYVDAMIRDFPYELKSKVAGPWTENLLKIDKSTKALNIERKKTFHTFVMNAMFFSKFRQPTVNNVISILS